MLARGQPATEQHRPLPLPWEGGVAPGSPYFQEGWKGISGTFDLPKLVKNCGLGNLPSKNYSPERIADSKALFNPEGVCLAGRASTGACCSVRGRASQGHGLRDIRQFCNSISLL